ncbi:AAA family ATPase [Shewanella sp. SW32]|uniref:AAA family ATPase n=1 Tax=unclassified Shewanella TaxID=196818 RepID=UPI0021D999AB|nr:MULTISPECIES: AAA family ATPase [unclassified Shewanella]MCU7964233.1 AAA family ATPase [Shewanella sp. SW32]MCU7972138.1 AAA family ATPase [Shewanella sp. SW29]
MARYCGNQNSAPLIKVARDFQTQSLISGISLLTKKPIWNHKTINELVKYFVDNLDEGEGDFFSKLETQLQPTSAEAKILLAEMLWFMSLCSGSVGPSSKRDTVERVFAFSGKKLADIVPADIQQAYLSDEVLTGIGKTGAAYNTGRWRELIYFIRLLAELLKLSFNERSTLLANHEAFSTWLELIPENSQRQFRHMILYLFYPDSQERIFGGGHRQSLLAKFANINTSTFKKMPAHAVDLQLLKIRKQFEQEYETQELDYYVEPLKSRWEHENGSATIAEQKAGYENKDKAMTEKINNTILNQILYGPPGTGKTYNTINRALAIVDPEYLSQNLNDRIKIKTRFDELVAKNRIGFVTFHQSFSYEDFVEGLKANSDATGKISYDIEDGIFKRMCDAANAKPIIAHTQRRVDVSGRKVWKMSLGDTLGDDAYIYEQCIENNYVLLGYGYNVDFTASNDRKGVIEAYKLNGIEIEKESNDYRVTSVQNFKNVMSIGDLIVISDGNRKFRAIAEVTGDYQFDPLAIDDDSYSQMRKVIWHRVYKPSLPVDELFNKNLSQMTLYRLREPALDVVKLQDVLLGEQTKDGTLPSVTVGTQISSYVIESISDEIISLRKPNGALLPLPRIIIDELVSLVKLNRISVDDIRSKRVFERIVDSDMEKFIINGYPNVLAPLVEAIQRYDFDKKAISLSDKRVLIIDEINRGNISNIFGELITLIEQNKRAGGSESLSVKLPYSKEPFSVPSNLHIIGTMNTADKSLAQVDIALRRRFEFVEMMPKHELLERIDVKGVNIAKLLETINQRIELLYDREHTIGHSFFLPLESDPTIGRLARIFELEILPLLEEYFFEDWERVGQVLGDQFKKTNPELKFIEAKYTDASVSKLMGSDWSQDSIRPYKRNMAAFTNPEAYIGIYDSPQG